jgi:hypothetical protein
MFDYKLKVPLTQRDFLLKVVERKLPGHPESSSGQAPGMTGESHLVFE